MHPHEKLINDLYEAFARMDPEGMARCYHPDASFSDTVFPMLKGPEVMAMWRMLISRAREFSLEVLPPLSADELAKLAASQSAAGGL